MNLHNNEAGRRVRMTVIILKLLNTMLLNIIEKMNMKHYAAVFETPAKPHISHIKNQL